MAQLLVLTPAPDDPSYASQWPMVLERLKEATGESAVKRKKEIEEERQLILAALNHYES